MNNAAAFVDAFVSSDVVISRSLNSLAPDLKLIDGVFGIKNDPDTLPSPSVTRFVLPDGCAVAYSWVFPNSLPSESCA